jgi:predicted DNA-binding ribbon-helix-helix protein
MKSSVIAGYKSASLEDAFWDDLRQTARGQGETLSQLAHRQHGSLTTSRLFVLGLLPRSRAQIERQVG